jgi:hypothetical protein
VTWPICCCCRASRSGCCCCCCWLQQQRDQLTASVDSAAFAAADTLQRSAKGLCEELQRSGEPALAKAGYAELEQVTRLQLAKLAAAQQKQQTLCAPRAAVWAAHERRMQQRLRRAQWQQRSIKRQQLLQQLASVLRVLCPVGVLLLLLYCAQPWLLAAAARVKLFLIINLADLLWNAVVGLAAVLLTVASKRWQ